jgi:hypothetical protein
MSLLRNRAFAFVERIKRKAWKNGLMQTPQRNQDKHNTPLLITCICLLTLVFFRADVLFGAVGLRPIYSIGGLILAAGFPLTALTLMTLWQILPPILTLILVIVFLVAPVIVPIAILFLGWFLAFALVARISPVIFLVCLGAAIIVWLILSQYGHQFKSQSLVRFITLCLLIFAAAYMLGTAFSPENAQFNALSSAYFEGHQYYLYLFWGTIEDPNQLILYECNQLAFACQVIYRAPYGYYQVEPVSLVPDSINLTLTIQLNAEILYIHHVT